MSLFALLFTGIMMSLIIVQITLIQNIVSAAQISLGTFQIGILLIWFMFSFAAFGLDS